MPYYDFQNLRQLISGYQFDIDILLSSKTGPQQNIKAKVGL